MASTLNKYVAGRYITNLKLFPTTKSTYYPQGFPGMDRIAYPIKIISITSRGKKIIFTLEFPDKSIRWLISFLGMTGGWYFSQQGHPSISLDISDSPEKKAEWTLHYDDTIKYGLLDLCHTEAEYDNIMKKVGPDILLDNITREQYIKAVRNPRFGKGKMICDFMMEQERFSGVGNYLRAEILYRARVYPGIPLNQLTDEQIGYIHYFTILIPREVLQYKGLTISDFKTPLLEEGTYPVQAYGRDKDPYGNPVEKHDFEGKGRKCHWVPMVVDPIGELRKRYPPKK